MMATAFVNIQLPQTIYNQFESMATRLEKSAETLLMETLQMFLAANNTPTDSQSEDLSNPTVNTLSSMTKNGIHQSNGYISVLSPEPDYVKPNLRDKPFIGMWRDREEMADSTTWVREMRQSQWGGRNHEPHRCR